MRKHKLALFLTTILLTVAVLPLVGFGPKEDFSPSMNASAGDWVDPAEYWELNDISDSKLFNRMRSTSLQAVAFELRPILYQPNSYSIIDDYEITDFTVNTTEWIVDMEKPAEAFSLSYSANKTVNNTSLDCSYQDTFELLIKDFQLISTETTDAYETYLYNCNYEASGKQSSHEETTYTNQDPDTTDYAGNIVSGEMPESFNLEWDDGILKAHIYLPISGEMTSRRFDSTTQQMVTETIDRSGDDRIHFQVTRVLLGESISSSANPFNKTSSFFDIAIKVVAFIIVAIIVMVIVGALSRASRKKQLAPSSSTMSIPPSSTPTNFFIRDSFGDLIVTDPITGQQSTYVSNKNSTYTNPLTGTTYTEAELIEQLAYRDRNRSTLSLDEQQANQDVNQNRNTASDRSDTSKQLAEDQKKKHLANIHEDYANKLAYKYGTTPGDDNQLKKAIIQDSVKAQVEYEKQMAKEAYLEAGQKTAESTKAATDVGVEVLSHLTGPAGKSVKTAYTLGSEIASGTAEAISQGKDTLDVMEAASIGAAKGAIGVIQDNVSGTGGKAAGNIVGDAIKEGLDAYSSGDDVAKAMLTGAQSGAEKTLIDVAMDTIGDAAHELKKSAIKNDLNSMDITDSINMADSDTAKQLASNYKKAGQAIDSITGQTGNTLKGKVDQSYDLPEE